MHAERVDGYNPLAVADAIKRKKATLEQGDGPVLLETITYRYSGHSPSDASSYRIKEEIEAWQAIDPLEAYAKEIINAGLVTSDQVDQRKADTTKAMAQACRLASSLEISPRLPSEKIAGLMFSKRKVENYDSSRSPELILPAAENPEFRHWQKSHGLALSMVNLFLKIRSINIGMLSLKLRSTASRTIRPSLLMGKKIVIGRSFCLLSWVD